MPIFLLIIGIAFIYFLFIKGLKNDSSYHANEQGGMKEKYKYLVQKMTDDPQARIVKLSNNHIHILLQGNVVITSYKITEKDNFIIVEWIASMGVMGTHKHKWTYEHNYPQEKIVQEMSEFIGWKTKEIFGYI